MRAMGRVAALGAVVGLVLAAAGCGDGSGADDGGGSGGGADAAHRTRAEIDEVVRTLLDTVAAPYRGGDPAVSGEVVVSGSGGFADCVPSGREYDVHASVQAGSGTASRAAVADVMADARTALERAGGEVEVRDDELAARFDRYVLTLHPGGRPGLWTVGGQSDCFDVDPEDSGDSTSF